MVKCSYQKFYHKKLLFEIISHQSENMTNCHSTQFFLGHIQCITDLDGILIIRIKIKLSRVDELSLAERLQEVRIILALGSSLLSLNVIHTF